MTLAAILIACVAAPGQLSAPKRTLTAEQAIGRAVAFCRAIGQPVSAEGTATFPATDRLYWQPRWTVKFGDQAELDVVDSSGMVAYYRNDAYDVHYGRRAAAQAIAEQDAIARARAVLAASGCKEPLSLKSATEAQHSVASAASTHVCYVTWLRTFHGVPYNDQHFTVSLNAETGEVSGFSATFFTAAPADAIEKVSEDDARKVASDLLASRGAEVSDFLEVKKEVVEPNHFWETGDTEQQPFARIAWTIRLRTRAGTTGLVWVDAETGAVIGGGLLTVARPRPKTETKAPAPAKK